MVLACLWVSYSDKKSLKIEQDNIEGICDPVISIKLSLILMRLKINLNT